MLQVIQVDVDFFDDGRIFPIIGEETVCLDAQENEVGVNDGARRDHLY